MEFLNNFLILGLTWVGIQNYLVYLLELQHKQNF